MVRRRRRASIVQGSTNIREAEMEAIKSHSDFKATEYVLVALSVTLLLSVYLVGGLAIPGQHETPNACHINAQQKYAPVRG
jgi:hypothetical protein